MLSCNFHLVIGNMSSYQQLLDDAMLSIVRKVLNSVEKEGIKDDQCFYISFRTDRPGVILSQRVKEKYPSEITIVLQYQFNNLKVHRNKFEVNIAFSGIPETIIVPFKALTSFIDPSENFSLQFKTVSNEEARDLASDIFSIDDISEVDRELSKETKANKKPGEVIALDKFRNKKK